MITRKERRAAEHAARKAARKAGFLIAEPQPIETPEAARTELPKAGAHFPSCETISNRHAPEMPGAASAPEPGEPFPSFESISQAQLDANRRNAQLSKGPLSPETRAISAQNHTSHGLARHDNGTFRLLTSESAETFAAFKQALIDEHKPATETETILVTSMAESHWLTQRAQRLQDTCTDPDTGVVTDDKKFSLYMRYFNTHKRGFHKCLHDFTKLRADQRKAENGFEAQRVKNEAHQMKKNKHYWEVLHKDAVACHQIGLKIAQNIKARSENPTFQAEYDAELAARNLKSEKFEVAHR